MFYREKMVKNNSKIILEKFEKNFEKNFKKIQKIRKKFQKISKISEKFKKNAKWILKFNLNQYFNNKITRITHKYFYILKNFIFA